MKKESRIVCFDVPNMAEADARDPTDIGAVQRLELALPPLGAFPVRVDMNDQIVCIDIYAPDASLDDIMGLFKKLGFQAILKGGS